MTQHAARCLTLVSQSAEPRVWAARRSVERSVARLQLSSKLGDAASRWAQRQCTALCHVAMALCHVARCLGLRAAPQATASQVLLHGDPLCYTFRRAFERAERLQSEACIAATCGPSPPHMLPGWRDTLESCRSRDHTGRSAFREQFHRCEVSQCQRACTALIILCVAVPGVSSFGVGSWPRCSSTEREPTQVLCISARTHHFSGLVTQRNCHGRMWF